MTGVANEAVAALPRFDPKVEGFFDDPYAHYALLRERNPIHADGRGTVFCFRYDDVRRVLVDPRSTSMDRERSLTAAGVTGARTAPPTFPLGLINRDPPDHSRVRRLLSQAFTQRKIESLVGWMGKRFDELVVDLERQQQDTGGPVDLVAGLAFPFPFKVISDLLGMPDGDDLQVRTWAHAISIASDPIVTREQVLTGNTAYRDISAYVADEVLPWKRANPGDDLLSHLLQAEGEGSLSRDELLDNVALLYVAGHETTSGLIGNGLLNLLRHRSQLERLRADPELLPNAVEELNRFDSSIQFAWRYVIDELAVGDVTLAPGTMAFVSCGSANRDPAQFGDDADELDITRASAKDLLSFGAGMHFCVGAHLARREATLVLGRVLERYPGLELAGEPRWNPRVTFRSLDELPVSLGQLQDRS